MCIICVERIYCSKRLIYICLMAQLSYCINLCFHLVHSDWKLEDSTGRVSEPNKPFYLKFPLWCWQKLEPLFLSPFPMTSVRLTDIWAFISVISSILLAEIIWCLNYLGFALCTDFLLLVSSCQTSVDFCIESCPAAMICLRNPQNMTENQSTASMSRENKLCRKFKVHLTHRLQCHFSSGSIFICFCFTIFLWVFFFFTEAYGTWHNISVLYNKIPAKVPWPCFLILFSYLWVLNNKARHGCQVLQNYVWITCGAFKYKEILSQNWSDSVVPWLFKIKTLMQWVQHNVII